MSQTKSCVIHTPISLAFVILLKPQWFDDSVDMDFVVNKACGLGHVHSGVNEAHCLGHAHNIFCFCVSGSSRSSPLGLMSSRSIPAPRRTGFLPVNKLSLCPTFMTALATVIASSVWMGQRSERHERLFHVSLRQQPYISLLLQTPGGLNTYEYANLDVIYILVLSSTSLISLKLARQLANC